MIQEESKETVRQKERERERVIVKERCLRKKRKRRYLAMISITKTCDLHKLKLKRHFLVYKFQFLEPYSLTWHRAKRAKKGEKN